LLSRLDDAKLKLIGEIEEDLRNEFRERRELNGRIKVLILQKARGTCPICGESEILIHLRGGITACRDCLEISADILRAAREPASREKLLLALKLQSSLEGEG